VNSAEIIVIERIKIVSASPTVSKSPVANLTYNAAAELLVGDIGEKHFYMRAVSGGGRGSRVAGVAQDAVTSHLATTALMKDAKGHHLQRGGVLPPGKYQCVYMARHRTFHECIWLNRSAQQMRHFNSPFAMHPIAHHRGNDFFIHGTGKLGSDGCIVPVHIAERAKLNHAIRDFSGNVYLTVTNVSYLLPAERFDGRMA
jgi:hypothetical protein